MILRSLRGQLTGFQLVPRTRIQNAIDYRGRSGGWIKRVLPLISLALLLTFTFPTTAAETLVSNLPDSGAVVIISGSVDWVGGVTIVGEQQFVLRDDTGTIVVETEALLHPFPMRTGTTRVRVTGTVERGFFGFGSKYIQASHVDFLDDNH
jgi:uncharacterized protein YdeI (BOF family)